MGNGEEHVILAGIEQRRPMLLSIWRFFDPSMQRAHGQEDALRRAVNRFQRLRPAFQVALAESGNSRRASRRSASTASSQFSRRGTVLKKPSSAELFSHSF